MNMGGFSWKRFLGISVAKSRISRTIGIPLGGVAQPIRIGLSVVSANFTTELTVAYYRTNRRHLPNFQAPNLGLPVASESLQSFVP